MYSELKLMAVSLNVNRLSQTTVRTEEPIKTLPRLICEDKSALIAAVWPWGKKMLESAGYLLNWLFPRLALPLSSDPERSVRES